MKNNIIKRLELVNTEFKRIDIMVDAVLIGGAALVFNIPNVRPTKDIDVFLRNPVCNDTVMEILKRYAIEDVTVASVPDPNEVTFEETLEFSNLTIYVIDIYGLAITKLFTNRAKDEEDLKKYILKNIPDHNKLDMLIEENFKDYVGNPNDMNLNVNHIDEYRNELGI